MNEFSVPPEGQDYITRAFLENPTNQPIHLISGEYKQLNKKILYPREKLQLILEIPAGYREFIKPDGICGKQVVYVGTRLEEAADPLIYTTTD